MSTPPSGPLLTVRATVVLLAAIMVGLVAGGLGYLAHHDVATGFLIGGGTVGGALVLFHTLVGR